MKRALLFLDSSLSKDSGCTEESSVLEPTKNVKQRLDRTDLVFMGVMTLLYLFIALFNLGDMVAPTTSWTPVKSDESFIVDLGRERNISRIIYYCGLGVGRDPGGNFRVEYQNGSGNYLPTTTLTKSGGDVFRWKYQDISLAKIRKIKIIADSGGAEIGEIGFFENGSQKPINGLKIIEKNVDSHDNGTVENLFDEPEKVVFNPSIINSTYFDEIYHARTAYEHLHRIEPFESTHPPLGKLFIGLGIIIFGMNAFGWRIIGTLFGVLMVPLMYLFGKKLFDGKFYGFCAAFLMMFDFMHFSQSRIATIDIYGTFFVILMFYYMYDYFINKSYELDFSQSLKPLFLSGLFFGLGVASKWIALYGATGLAFLFGLSKYLEYRDYSLLKKSIKARKMRWLNSFIPIYLWGTIFCCILFFIVIPGIIYLLSWVPFMMVPGPGHELKDVFTYQMSMYNYHAHLVATHPFSSEWWQWPLMTKPLWAYDGHQYFNLPGDKVSSIFLMGNPAVFWVGILGVITAFIMAVRKRDKKMVVVFTAIAAQYLPWMLVHRLTFIYHFFSILPFVILAIVYAIKNMVENDPQTKYIVYAYLAVVLLLFICFYPIISGMIVDRSYVAHLKLLDTWSF
jgi:dolichyl-phosphate-mannose--protein O-mannosyl transferase